MGVPQDLAAATKWIRLAAEQGNAEAQHSLGLLYWQRGVFQTLPLAHMWLNIAGAKGIDNAREARLRLEAEMSGDDISRAQQMARNCHESNYRDCGE